MIRNLLFVVIAAVLVGQAHAEEEAPGNYTVTAAPAAGVKIDGDLAEWKEVSLLEVKKPTVDDLEVLEAHFCKDATTLYFSIRVQDHKLVNSNLPEKLHSADSVVVQFCIDPAKGRQALTALSFSPTSKDGKPAMLLKGADGKAITAVDRTEAGGVKWVVKATDSEWSVEASAPLAALGIAGKDAVPFLLVVYDRDDTEKDEWAEWQKRAESSNKKKNPDTWRQLLMAK